jgi:spore germination protein GerM
LALLGLVTAGCAIPTESGPSGIAPSHVPFNLLSPVLPTTTTTQPRASSLVPVKIYLLASSGQLTGVDRVVQSPAPLASVITALLAGPSSSEVDNHMSTAIPNNVTVLSATPSAQGVVTVNFNDAFGLITGTAAEQAVSQVVATVATQVGLGTGVIFEISGQRTSVPIASGAQVPGPVYLLQFIP